MKIDFIKKLDKIAQYKILGLLLTLQIEMATNDEEAFKKLDKAIKEVINFVY